MSIPPPYKTDFLKTCLQGKIIEFGNFTLKSGRESPYFFNAGHFMNKAEHFRTIQAAYAQCLIQYASLHPEFGFDVLFGPAYKGIPLAAATFTELARLDVKKFGQIGCAFNRKELKDHGDMGILVGASLEGKRIMLLDDVLTAGTAVRECVQIIQAQGGELAGIIVAFDRMEKMPAKEGEDTSNISALGQMRRDFGVPVLGIINFLDLVEMLKETGSETDLERMKAYRKLYGSTE
jgi:orotate phosphoribosyltransferase